VTEQFEATDADPPSPLSEAMAGTLKVYVRAGYELANDAYASVRESAPPNFRVPCHVYVVCCPDGVLVRYDVAGDEQPRVRYADSPESLTKIAPRFSENVVHVPDNPATYVPETLGPSLTLGIQKAGEVQLTPFAQGSPIIFTPKVLPSGFPGPQPSERPPCLAAFSRELQIQIQGEIGSNLPAGAIKKNPEQFIAHAIFSLPVGWLAIEVYPRLEESFWKPEYASAWAKIDLLSAIAQRNVTENALLQLDGRGAAREHYAKLLEELENFLCGSEEPCHQFLKSHPELICPTHDVCWSKMAFGQHVSDFVFREPNNDYLLVEIEAPRRLLFRKDGHPRQELNHAIGQIRDWVRYIQDNKAQVEIEQGLVGVSATPRTLIVIGRAASLTEENRRSLVGMQSEQPRLTILTYDDLVSRARAELERLLGPLSAKSYGGKLYFFPAEDRR
jgi:hypothetical protein